MVVATPEKKLSFAINTQRGSGLLGRPSCYTRWNRNHWISNTRATYYMVYLLMCWFVNMHSMNPYKLAFSTGQKAKERLLFVDIKKLSKYLEKTLENALQKDHKYL